MTTSHYGQCPRCQSDPAHLLNYLQEIFGLCPECLTYWQIAPILAQRWTQDIPANWKQNGKTLAGYQKVQPINYPQIENMRIWTTPARYR